jgi:uncharacterized protein YbbC (DUF1343 family)
MFKVLSSRLTLQFLASFSILHFLFLLNGCAQPVSTSIVAPSAEQRHIASFQPAAHDIPIYLPKLKGKTIGIVANQTSTVGARHLVDTLLALGVNIKAVFAPEHGFRGNADAGQKVKDAKDPSTGLPIISLYGKNMKPSKEQLAGIDMVVFDIQDVGARFYTYISTMSYMMEACAEQGIAFMVLDRPNPNGHYVDGPILDTAFRSFIGMHPIPVVHGMTMAEYALMVNGEGWLKGAAKCKLEVVKMEGYSRSAKYALPEKPSPNLPNMRSIYLYPSTCFFEGTVASEGRGTLFPFQLFGYPDMKGADTTFTPMPIAGASSDPKFKNVKCKGISLATMLEDSAWTMGRIQLSWLIDTYRGYPQKDKFFNADFFDKLAGSSALRKQIIAGKSESEIRSSWAEGLQQFRQMREKYLLYP